MPVSGLFTNFKPEIVTPSAPITTRPVKVTSLSLAAVSTISSSVMTTYLTVGFPVDKSTSPVSSILPSKSVRASFKSSMLNTLLLIAAVNCVGVTSVAFTGTNNEPPTSKPAVKSVENFLFIIFNLILIIVFLKSLFVKDTLVLSIVK